MSIQARISGTGSYLPERVLTNFDLEKLVETSDAWIRERTGIASRHVAAVNQTNTDMALEAARRALETAQLKPSDIDAIIFATVTPDQVMPSSACTLQSKLGCGPIVAFDLSAACSGFIYSLNLADSWVRTGQYKHVLVVGSEALSRVVNFKDRETCILFGDGAGCVVVSADETSKAGFHSFYLRANGSLGELLSLDTGRPQDPMDFEAAVADLPYVHMRGREIFKSAVRAMSESCEAVMKAHGITHKEVDWFIPHQANIRIIQAVGDSLGIDSKKAIINIENTGNTSSATIPIAFDQAVRDGRIRRGQTVMLGAFGAGLTYGATLFTY